MTQLLTHSNEAAGTTVLGDGTKLYWTEGYSDTIVQYPNGRRETVSPFEVEDHPLVDELVDPAYDQRRAMTAAEEAEHAAALN